MSEAREGFVPNPILAGLLGIYPVIAISRSFAEGVVYGLGAAFCAFTLGAVLPPARSIISERLQTPATLVLSAALAIVFASIVRLFSSWIEAGLWIYLPLLSVSSLSMATIRGGTSADRFGPDGRSKLGTVAFEALVFFLTSAFVGGLREMVGLGSLTLPTPGIAPIQINLVAFAPLRVLVTPAGGFILLGFLVAIYRAAVRRRGRDYR